MVDRTYYTDGAQLTYEEKDHLISFITDVENYNINHETPAHYGQHVPLVHVLNYGNIHGAKLHPCLFCIYSYKAKLHG